MKTIIEVAQENNEILKQILTLLTSDDEKLKTLATNFGIGICSNIVGDRLLGL